MIRIAILTLALWTGACASNPSDTAATGPATGRDCFRVSQVQGWNVLDDQNVEVRVSGIRRYALTTNSPRAGELRSATGFRIGIDAPAGDLVCVGEAPQIDLHASIGGIAQRYPITRITRLPDPGGS